MVRAILCLLIMAGCNYGVVRIHGRPKSESLIKSWRQTLPITFSTSQSTESVASHSPNVEIDDNGNAILVWTQQTGGVSKLYKSEFRSGSWTHPSNLSEFISPIGGDVEMPEVAMDNLNNAVIVWAQSDGQSKQVFKSEYRAGIWTHPASINDNISPNGQDAKNFKLASNNGVTVIVWQQSDGVNEQIFKSEYRAGAWTHPTGPLDNISPDGGNAQSASVAIDDSGNAIIVWSQFNGLVEQIFKSEYRLGSWINPADLNDSISVFGTNATVPQVSMDNGGNAIIVWQQPRGPLFQIYKSEYRLGAWIHPGSGDNISPGSDAFSPKVVTSDSGVAVIVWTQFDGANNQVYKSEYRSGAWVHPGVGNYISQAGQTASALQVDMDDSGRAIIVWQQSDGFFEQIFVSEFLTGVWVHPLSLGDNISSDGSNVSGPQVAISSGNVIIVWDQVVGTNTQIFKSEYRSGAWAHPGSLNNSISVRGRNSGLPRVALNDGGDATVVWTQFDGSYDQIFKSEFRAGTWLHPASLSDNISPDGAEASQAQVAIDKNGNTVIVWKQTDGSFDQIFISEYRAGAWRHPTGPLDNISPDGSDANSPMVGMDGNGDVIVAWQQSDGSNEQIFKSEYRLGTWSNPAGLNDNVSPDGADAQGIHLDLGSNGVGIIAWGQSDGANEQIFKSEYRAGTWTHPAGPLDNISPDGQDAQSASIAIDDNGDAVIVWSQSVGGNLQIFKSEYRAGSWSHPANLTDNISPDIQSVSAPQVAYKNGRGVILWEQSDGSHTQIFKSEYLLGTWRHPVDLNDNISPDGQVASSPRIALDKDGNTLIAFYTAYNLRVLHSYNGATSSYLLENSNKNYDLGINSGGDIIIVTFDQVTTSDLKSGFTIHQFR